MLSDRQQHCLQGIGIRLWQTRPTRIDDTGGPVIGTLSEVSPLSSSPVVEPVAPVAKADTAPAPATFDLDDWPRTLAAIEACQQCELARTCHRKVPGKGNQQADLMIIGEAPGHDEDLQGLPFVGRAGKLLDKMLQAIGLDLEQVYITNILKCRPPNNRDPRPDEVQACSPFLQAQIRLLKPKVILSVGRISAQNLLQEQSPLGKLRGRQHRLPQTDIPLLVTYHPAYLLRNPADKAKAWEDLKALQRVLQHAEH